MIYQLENISKSFKEHVAVSDVNFEIKEPGIYGLLGPNGAGKTTLLKMMLKILSPSLGSIEYMGTDIERLGGGYYKEIGAVLEGSRNLYWYLSARQNIRYSGRLIGMTDRAIEERSEEMLRLMELTEHADKKVGYLSRGMQQKVAIIVALLHKPKVLFLDEPTLGLDIGTKNKMITEIQKMADRGATIFLTTHQIDLFEQLSTTLLILESGKITYRGSKEKLLKLYEKNNNVSIEVSADTQGENVVQGMTKYQNVTWERKDDRFILTVTECMQSQIDKILQKLIVGGGKIHSVTSEKPNLEDTLLKFWTTKGEI